MAQTEYQRQWYLKKKSKFAKVCIDCGNSIGYTGIRCRKCACKERARLYPPPSQKGTRHKYWDKENNPKWKGGFYKIGSLLRNCPEYKEWRKNIFKQDDYTCQGKCKKRGGKIEADHSPILFSELLRKYNITTYEQGRFCKELWKAKGQVLCEAEHRLKDRINYGNQHTKN